MLHFKKITLKNFGPYKGTQSVEFENRPGVTIFWGENGRGKTSLLNAFRFALFGQIERRNGQLKDLSEMENRESAKDGVHGFSVSLEMQNGTDQYNLTRSYKPSEGSGNNIEPQDYIEDCFLNKNGSILSKEDMSHEINLIMPPSVSRFFLFDGELLSEYEELLELNNADGEEIKKEIETILGVPVLQYGVMDIDECRAKYENQKNKASEKDSKCREFVKEIASHDEKIENSRNIIAEKEQQTYDLCKKKNGLDQQVKDSEQFIKIIERRNLTEEHLDKTNKSINSVKSKMKDLMRDAWKGMLISRIREVKEKLNEEKDKLENKRIKGKVAKKFLIEIKKAIEDQKCPICERDISPDLIKKLEEKISNSDTEYSGLSEYERKHLNDINFSFSTLEKLEEESIDLRKSLEELESQLETLETERTVEKNTLSDLKEDINRLGKNESESNVLHLNRLHSELTLRIENLREGIAKEKIKLDTEIKEKKDLSDRISRLARNSDFQKAQKRFELCDKLYNIFEESKILYRDRLKKNVEKDASDIFVKLSEEKEYTGLKINENYGLEILLNSGEIVPGRSSGYEHIVALSLIGALHKNAPLRGPIVIDSPFGRMDGTNTTNIIKTLPDMEEQTILLAYVGEIDPQVARKELRSHLVQEYKLERVSAMHTEIRKDHI